MARVGIEPLIETKKVMNPKKPIHFSDYFGIDKSKLDELGVFDPILNVDTKVFVEPLLLKNSSSGIIKRSYESYKAFFAALLRLLQKSVHVDDRCWRAAKKMVHFPEYQYSCIGYSSGNTEGRGFGTEFNDRILQSAKEIVELAQGDPEIFLLLPLLEEGIAGDRISDMVQNIIDDDICRYTVDIMTQIRLQGHMSHNSTKDICYSLLQNPFSKSPIKLLPKDILSNLPIADDVGSVVHELTAYNERLRGIVNRDIAYIWLETTKSAQKELLLKELKTNKSFFIETLKALKEYGVEHYDLEKDHEGLYKWLADSEHLSNFKLPQAAQACSDDLEALGLVVTSIIHHFKNLIEEKDIWRLFWTRYTAMSGHVREYYSQMIFFTVCSTWLTSQNSNITLDILRDAGSIKLRFSIANDRCLVLHVKHANNPSLAKIYTDILEKYRYLDNEKHVYMVMNFEAKPSTQLKEIRVIENPICKILEIDTVWREQTKDTSEISNAQGEFIEFEDLDFEGAGYREEKRKGGRHSYQRHKPLKNQVEVLCKQELANKKDSCSSALQLCMVVAGRIVKEYPNLLASFTPYKNHGVQGHDWTKPTFYGWCNDVFKVSQNAVEGIEN